MKTPRRFRLTSASLICLVFVTSAHATRPDAPPKPLDGHPGNVFHVGEDVTIALPNAAEPWRLVDYDNKPVASGGPGATAVLGKLPAGYYEVHQQTVPRVTLAVIPPLVAPTPHSSPIGADVAMAWFFHESEPRQRAVANVATLAGINWVRDRMIWGEIEPTRGTFAASTRYDVAINTQSEAGLRILQVNHSSPQWANPDPKRFPLDLRDAYNFNRAIAKRWAGKVQAYEPWNEPDIGVFGGHTGAEIAAMQKASYLGIKAGDPAATASMAALALPQQPILDDLRANAAWPYFDTFNLHHYVPTEQYAAVYASFRTIASGRPMWASEFSMPVPWAEEKTKEPADEMLHEQARRVPMAFAAALHEGAAPAWYFILPDYVEGQTQFGALHADLTPRPAYAALAAVGRLLADAKPQGRVKHDNAAARAFVFDAKPDGKLSDVMVAWATEPVALELPAAPQRLFDHIGRELPKLEKTLALTPAPVFVILAPETIKFLPLDPPPAPAEKSAGEPSPVVLQAVWPQASTVAKESAYAASPEKPQPALVMVYNFSPQPVKGTLAVTAPKGWDVTLSAEPIELPPGERKELAMTVKPATDAKPSVETLVVKGDFGPSGEPILSFRVIPQPPATQPAPAAN
jgi:hypothetical protein